MLSLLDPLPSHVEVNGVKISGALIPQIIAILTNPDPKRWYRFERNGDMVTAETKLQHEML